MSMDGGGTWDLVTSLARYEEESQNLICIGKWQVVNHKTCSCSMMKRSQDPMGAIIIPYLGKSVSWIGTRGPDHGIAKAYLDGKFYDSVDLYAPQNEARQVLLTISTPSIEYHELGVKATTYSNPSSTGKIVGVDAFDVIYN
jgi:hypothetical protein